ncbi:hypothetical protein SuNHUV7_08670 (plasmid) [Pseudoseohaeicola sp. NH-UV-7]|nr:hypothetical protein [Sulfitobacter sp. JL08]
MLRPVRTLIMLVAVFMAGVLFERSQNGQACDRLGGQFESGICRLETQ